jgi:protein SCO1/2
VHREADDRGACRKREERSTGSSHTAAGHERERYRPGDGAEPRLALADSEPMNAGAPSTEPKQTTQAMTLRIVLPAIVILVVLAGVTLLLTGGSSKPLLPGNAATTKTPIFEGVALSPPQPAPSLSTLRNYDGAKFNLAAQRGKAVFVTFLYAHCPDICPLIASNLHNAYAAMTPKQRRRAAIVAVSVAAFVRQHQLTREASYLIGTAPQLSPVWEAWKVGSQRDSSNPALLNHSALIYGIGASGKIETIYPANFAPHELIHDLAPLLRH